MRIARSFVLDEFECHDGTDVPDNLLPNVIELASKVLQPVRDVCGPIVVISGYRTPEYNDRVKGAKNSTHLTAEGADVRAAQMPHAEFVATVNDMIQHGRLPRLGGMGVYRTWIHLDIRKAADGHLRRWNGKGVGSEQ